jgi:hypothetical protein
VEEHANCQEQGPAVAAFLVDWLSFKAMLACRSTPVVVVNGLPAKKQCRQCNCLLSARSGVVTACASVVFSMLCVTLYD